MARNRNRPAGEPGEWLTRKEAAKYLGVSAETLRVKIDAGEVRVYRPSANISWLRKADLDEYIRRHITAG